MKPAFFYILFVFFTLMIVSARDTGENELPADNQFCQSISTNSGITCLSPESGISLKKIIGTPITRDIFHGILLKNINLSCINMPVRTHLNRNPSDTFIALGQRALLLLFFTSYDQDDHHPVK